MEASPDMQKYFDRIESEVKRCHDIAVLARKKGLDPEDIVEVQLAKNMAERVVGLISVIAPQIIGSGVNKRIIELEKKYGIGDWRVGMQVAYEIAQEKYCKFEEKKEAIEVGIRTGFAYVTVGVVSAPLEGLINIDIKQRHDGGEYFCLNYAGPIRNAGGTAAATSVLIADYVRHKMGYGVYDPDEKEIKRCHTEIDDYHNRVTNLQYYPSDQESEFLMKNIPVEISGNASERFEVSNYKDLPRVPVNRIRAGYCLIHSSCIPLKGPKLWKQLSKWGKEMDMSHWDFLEEFVNLQKQMKSKGQKAETDSTKILPDFTFIADLVAGRPVLSHPLKNGGFRLRYGRSRTSGYSAMSLHPATMHVLNDFIGAATHIKVERPSKGAAITACDTIEGPIVKLKDGSVEYLDTEQQAKAVKKEVVEVLYLGDILQSYGDFLNRAHTLVPPGYCEEWYIQEVEKAIVDMYGSLDLNKVSYLTGIPEESFDKLIVNPMTKISAKAAFKISSKLDVPLHPHYTYHWNSISKEDFVELLELLKNANIKTADNKIEKMVLLYKEKQKRALELIGIPHSNVNNEFIVIMGERAASLAYLFDTEKELKGETTLELVNSIAKVKVRDKSGIFVGARMGRPEKAKMRTMTGTPHTLFPVGKEGGRLRSFQAAMQAGKVTAELPTYVCESCEKETIFRVCDCGKPTKKKYVCMTCGLIDKPECQHGEARPYRRKQVDIVDLFKQSMAMLGERLYPDLIKGVRGTSNIGHIPEHLVKGILRAKHEIYVNKDGTTRYDASEVPITHFKPLEIGTTIERLRQLGYAKDIKGNPLERPDQILEIKPQDLVIPCCDESPDKRCDDILFKITKFLDELFEKVYGLNPYYNLKTREDLVGHYLIGLAPHTSAGSIGRIIGFSKTQGFFAHPLFHAAMRRDCDGDESCYILLLDAFVNFSRKFLPSHTGSTMDAPLVLTSILAPTEVDDMAFDVDIVWKYPLEFYEACEEYKKPWDVKITQINDFLNTPKQYEDMGFTHDTADFNQGVLCSSYKILPSMEDKLKCQMALAEKLRCVDEHDVARLVIEKHFIRDVKGNLRKFSQQKFRCVHCNESYRRPPLVGRCMVCKGKIVFTIHEGSIVKYLGPSMSLASKYNVPVYLKQTLELTKRRVEGMFGREKEVQTGLGAWFG